MRHPWLTALKRFVLWDYSRGSVPYDIMVGLILAFIFLTPRYLFRDQPKPNTVVMVAAENDAAVFWLDPGLLTDYAKGEQWARVEKLIRTHAKGKRFELKRVDPIFDSEKEIKGYLAIARPLN